MLTEWGLTPEYINEKWTEELLSLMFQKRNERIERWNAQSAGKAAPTPERRRVSDMELFQTMGIASGSA